MGNEADFSEEELKKQDERIEEWNRMALEMGVAASERLKELNRAIAGIATIADRNPEAAEELWALVRNLMNTKLDERKRGCKCEVDAQGNHQRTCGMVQTMLGRSPLTYGIKDGLIYVIPGDTSEIWVEENDCFFPAHAKEG